MNEHDQTEDVAIEPGLLTRIRSRSPWLLMAGTVLWVAVRIGPAAAGVVALAIGLWHLYRRWGARRSLRMACRALLVVAAITLVIELALLIG